MAASIYFVTMQRKILYRPDRLVSGDTKEEKGRNDDIAGIIPYLPVSGQMKGVKRAPGQAYQK